MKNSYFESFIIHVHNILTIISWKKSISIIPSGLRTDNSICSVIVEAAQRNFHFSPPLPSLVLIPEFEFKGILRWKIRWVSSENGPGKIFLRVSLSSLVITKWKRLRRKLVFREILNKNQVHARFINITHTVSSNKLLTLSIAGRKKTVSVFLPPEPKLSFLVRKIELLTRFRWPYMETWFP